MNSNDDFIRHVDRLLQEFQQILNGEKKRRRKTASRFSLLESFGVTRSESVHSTFLKFLLDPMERHDQGDFFLSTFLEFLGLAFQQGATQGASVTREADLKPFGRVDIRIRLTNGHIVLIENKVDAEERPDQMDDYLEWLRGQGAPDGFSHQIVFLTPEGREPVSTTRPEDVVCVSYSRLADWVAASRQRIEAPRLGFVLDHYADTGRVIGETMRRDAMPDAIRQFLLDPEEPGRFEAALELVPHIESYRGELSESFLHGVTDELTIRLQAQNYAERWVVEFDRNLFDGSSFRKWKGWKIAWRDRQGRPHFAVRVEYGPGEDGLFYGVTRGFGVRVGGQHRRDTELQNRLHAAGFKTATAHWPGLRSFGKDGLPRFDLSRTDDVLELHHGLDGLTGQVVNLVWELFEAFRPQLGELNCPWLYDQPSCQ